MSGAGALQDMVNRFNENRNKLRKRPDAKTRMRERLLSGLRRNSADFYKDNIPRDVVEKVKEDIRGHYRAEKQKSILLFAASVILTVLAIIFTLWIISSVIGNLSTEYRLPQ